MTPLQAISLILGFAAFALLVWIAANIMSILLTGDDLSQHESPARKRKRERERQRIAEEQARILKHNLERL